MLACRPKVERPWFERVARPERAASTVTCISARRRTGSLTTRLVHAGLLRAKRGLGGGVILLFVHDCAPACVRVMELSDALGLTWSIGLKLLAYPVSEIGLGATIRRLEEMNTTPSESLACADRSVRFVSHAMDCFIELLDNFSLADLASGKTAVKVRRSGRATHFPSVVR